MSSPENNSRLEELAALWSLGQLDDRGQQELFDLVQNHPEAARLVREFTETVAALAHDAPQVEPPASLKKDILHQLPPRAHAAKIISFPAWAGYAIAACLMIVGVLQARQIMSLKSELAAAHGEMATLVERDASMKLRLAVLEAKDQSYASSKVLVAWDPDQHRGTIAMQNLPPAPAGHDYQLWLLDPETKNPISAGIISLPGSFGAKPASNSSPAFAISLEPSGGSPSPTGPILFASTPAL